MTQQTTQLAEQVTAQLLRFQQALGTSIFRGTASVTALMNATQQHGQRALACQQPGLWYHACQPGTAFGQLCSTG